MLVILCQALVAILYDGDFLIQMKGLGRIIYNRVVFVVFAVNFLCGIDNSSYDALFYVLYFKPFFVCDRFYDIRYFFNIIFATLFKILVEFLS